MVGDLFSASPPGRAASDGPHVAVDADRGGHAFGCWFDFRSTKTRRQSAGGVGTQFRPVIAAELGVRHRADRVEKSASITGQVLARTVGSMTRQYQRKA